jgi:O-antigen ligase
MLFSLQNYLAKFTHNKSQNFSLYLVLVFLVVFICLPMPHGNFYPFVGLTMLSVFQWRKGQFKYLNTKSIPYSLLIWLALSIFWVSDKILMLKAFSKIGFVLLGGWIWWSRYSHFKEDQKLLIQKSVFYASLGVVAIILLDILRCEIFYGGYPSQNAWFKFIGEHITNALVHGCIACSLGIWVGLNSISRIYRTIIISLAVFTIFRATSDAAALGFLLGGVTLILHKFFPHFVRLVFIYGMPAVWIAFPFIFKIFTYSDFLKWAPLFDTSYTHRLFIWSSASEQVFQRFWTGFGLGSSRYRHCFVEPVDIPIWSNNQKMILSAPEACLHPHNFMVQFWLEVGAVGVILGCLAWLMYWRKRFDKCDGYTMAFWGSALCVAATSISVWQSWWLILLVVLTPIYSQKVYQNSVILAK